jgi:peptidoglycan/xylan/chitin deacetylase (PgdA/CDA1 family)
VDGDGATVELTFDDGPDPTWTPLILRTLNREGVHATFFELGAAIDRSRPLARQIALAGDELGSHAQDHVDLTKLPAREQAMEISAGAAAITAATGRRTACLRPPFGAQDAQLARSAARAGERLVLWTVDPRDWSTPGTRTIVDRVLENVRPGSIVLLHDGGGDRSQTLAAIPRIVSALRSRGYGFATVRCWG